MSLKMLSEVSYEFIKQTIVNILAPLNSEQLNEAIEKDYSFIKKLKEIQEKLHLLDPESRKIVKSILDLIRIAKEIAKSFPPSAVIDVLKMKNVLAFLKEERPDIYDIIVNHPNGKKWLKKRLVEIAKFVLDID